MISIRAIYIGDVRFDQCSVFELDTETDRFEMITDKIVSYEKEVVYKDDDFIVFEYDKKKDTVCIKSTQGE